MGSALAEKAYETADVSVADSNIKLASMVSVETEPAKLTPSWFGGVYTREESLDYTSSPNALYGVVKRFFDIVFSAACLIILSPVYLVIAVLVSVESKGSAVYTQTRIGKNGKPFTLYKFRTMCVDAEKNIEELLSSEQLIQWKREYKVDNDPRITNIGRFLRATSLDEFPQFYNILKGDMSLIGPRPVTHEETLYYGKQRKKFLSVLPGVTGYWQVFARNDASYAENSRTKMELYYVENQGFSLDVKIFVQTFAAIIRRSGK